MQLTQYACLALDHDDTVVRTTPDVHYPSFVETLRLLRPEMPVPTLREFIQLNCDIGFAAMCDKIGFTPEEMEVEARMWRKWTNSDVPHAYEGMRALIRDFQASGGRICVVSHSEKDVILRDYRVRFDAQPDLVFGWELPRDKRKPAPYALDEIMREFSLAPKDVLVVDDLKLGLDMAKSRHVDFAWAGWSETAFVTGDYMRRHSTFAFEAVEQLYAHILKD